MSLDLHLCNPQPPPNAPSSSLILNVDRLHQGVRPIGPRRRLVVALTLRVDPIPICVGGGSEGADRVRERSEGVSERVQDPSE